MTTAILKGMLSKIYADEVNSVNAPIIAKDMGIKVTESTSPESVEYTNLITVKTITAEKENLIEKFPSKKEQLYKKLQEWRNLIDAPIPQELNPEYDLSKEK